MSLFWPGDTRAAGVFDDAALLLAMTTVEVAWYQVLSEAGLAPPVPDEVLRQLTSTADLSTIAAQAEAGGNPVIAAVAVMRTRLDEPAASWLHRGLTSQDVLDTALVLLVRDLLDEHERAVRAQVTALVDLAARHRGTPMTGRTLGQAAVPHTFGLKVASWLTGLLDAAAPLAALRAALPIQLGGAAGTRSAITLLTTARRGTTTAAALVEQTAERLGLASSAPWATNRWPFTRTADLLTALTGAWSRIANDVITLSRSEISELSEPVAAGRGGSSTMPHKANPILSILIRRAGLAAPGAAAELHLAAADMSDERPAGAWHLEWAPLQRLARLSAVAASQVSELVTGLVVDAPRMAQNLALAGDSVRSERDGLAQTLGLTVDEADPYLGDAGALVDAAIVRARIELEQP
jgi:3-carboxy-cis,cis-muconate cycloisomerase